MKYCNNFSSLLNTSSNDISLSKILVIKSFKAIIESVLSQSLIQLIFISEAICSNFFFKELSGSSPFVVPDKLIFFNIYNLV